mmetsp:Transcript_5489/g.14130  ORF Transcript_5489/g.14130 Transcript_5489/m.14130 type:complete len:147 (+) Transcript_5489:21-461(+)|eukprot:CAMPEP_0197414550 /NCGR_PEP_ID=MMETSP1170-20131217/1251_1 /TAXON_ID=54406 /ORGANISM="Sarcinochrysis sp, Strain CCMP770" /LENGTH=146 /DNA_ID=CAMNT_0042941271 /DNA_START=21 /DNA_END=461 /DNA_ORIENTATION=-
MRGVMRIWLVVVGAGALVVVPRGPGRATRLAAKKEDDRMAKFYKDRFSASAAEEYRFARERDKSKYNAKRAKSLGVQAGEEFDLDRALDANTDDTITKIIAGAFIVSVLVALYFGVIQSAISPPSFTDAAGTTYVKDPKTGVFRER